MRPAAIFCLCVCLCASAGVSPLAPTASAQAPSVGRQLIEAVSTSNEHYAAGRYAEAEPHARRAVELGRQALRPNDYQLSLILHRLGAILEAQGRFREAEPLYLEALQIGEAAHGPQSPELIAQFETLSDLYYRRGRHAEAATYLERVLAAGASDPSISDDDRATTLNNLGLVYRETARFDDAERRLVEAGEIFERLYGGDHPSLASVLNNLGLVYRSRGRYGAAETVYERALDIRERALGENHPNTAQSLANLAVVRQAQGRFDEAEDLLSRSLAIREIVLGPDHPDTSESIGSLGRLYLETGRFSLAEPLLRRAIEVRERALGPDHPDVIVAQGNLAAALHERGAHEEAVALYERVRAASLRVHGEAHPEYARILTNLAVALVDSGRYEDAISYARRSVEIREALYGPVHFDTASSLHTLAGIYRAQDQFAPAEALYQRASMIWRSNLGDQHPSAIMSLNDLASLAWAQNRFAEAESLSRSAATAARARLESGLGLTDGELSGNAGGLRAQEESVFETYLTFAADAQADGAELDLEFVFAAMQSARNTRAGRAVRRAGARAAAPDAAAAELARQRQDAIDRIEALEFQLVTASSEGDILTADELRAQLEAEHAAAEASYAQLTQRFPDYARLTAPRIVDIAEMQALLAEDEAVIIFVAAAGDLAIFALRHDRAVFSTAPESAARLEARVRTLRVSLDPSGAASASELPVFDIQDAYRMYRALFDEVAGALDGVSHLTVIADGPLESLPFHVLLTEPPDPELSGEEAYRAASWLSNAYAITHAPSVATLAALRSGGAPADGATAFIGFADPAIGVSGGSLSASSDIDDFLLMNGRYDLASICALRPAPQTRAMALSMAEALGAGEDAVIAGRDANEARLRALSESGELAAARVIAFSTHGLVAGEAPPGSVAEPALVLTPDWNCEGEAPARHDAAGDGLLTASEVATLALSADWVLLTACNTAASDGRPNAEPLSGLARAFFYAGARALLVSHWPADAGATQILVEHLFDPELRELARAERLSRAMSETRAQEGYAHPALWAPFVVVGG